MGTTPMRVAFGRCTTTPVAVAIWAFGSNALSAGVLGSLEATKRADLVVIDRDYLTVPIDEIKDIRPVMTIVGGKVVYRAH